MSLEEFVCAVAVMHRGTAPEQLRMLFEVRCQMHVCLVQVYTVFPLPAECPACGLYVAKSKQEGKEWLVGGPMCRVVPCFWEVQHHCGNN